MIDAARLAHRLRRFGYRSALTVFRYLPGPVRRGAVRVATPAFTVGAVCAFVHDDAVLLLRQRHRSDWSLPGGLLDRGEGPGDAVVRETREELGLRIEVGLPAATLVDGPARRVDVIFRVDVTERFPVRPRGEAFAARWLRLDELDEESAATADALGVMFRSAEPGATQGRLLP